MIRTVAHILSSMLQSLSRGELTEIAYLNGYIVRKAAAAGVRVPVNDLVVRIVDEISRGTRAIAHANLVALCTAQ